MYERVEKASGKTGLPPGRLVYVGDEGASEALVRCLALSAGGIEEFTLEKLPSFMEDSSVSVVWVDVRGLNSAATGQVMDLFALHVLLMEDVLDTGSRPKVELSEEYAFVLGKRFSRKPDGALDDEQMILMLKGKCVLTIQETLTDSFPAVEGRLPIMREKRRTAAYLFYALLDTLIDSYYPFIENLGDEIEELDQTLMETAGDDAFRQIRMLKKEMLLLRRTLWATREVLHRLLNESERHFSRKMIPYLRDVYDNILQMLETVDMYRDMVDSAMDLYLSSASSRLNEVMKVLTMISTVFIPITFIAGLYGMNFSDMPELSWRYGYPASLLIMLVCVLVMLRYFKKKKWL